MISRTLTSHMPFMLQLTYILIGLIPILDATTIALRNTETARAENTSFLVLVGYMVLCIVVAAATALHVRSFLKKRSQNLRNFANENNFQYSSDTDDQLLLLTALYRVKNVQNRQQNNLVIGHNWKSVDYSHEQFHWTRFGTYKAGKLYVCVVATQLPRKLPNVFFDALKMRGRQFGFQFAKRQRHSLEGDFDRYFVTYFPEDYTIDSMSFITPEVMQALKTAANYDVEIVDDWLYLYGPLDTSPDSLHVMADRLAEIKKALMNNIVSYRDQRLPAQEGRQSVAVEGQVLKSNRFWLIAGATTLAAYVAIRIIVTAYFL